MDIHRIEMVWLEMIDSSPVQKVPVACMCDDLFNGSLTIAEGSIQDVPRTEDQCIPFPDNIHEQIKQIILVPITILILGCNSGVLCLIVANKIFRTPAYLLIANLGLADLTVGVVSISTMLTQAKEETMDLCLVRIGFTIACCVSSIICLMCIAIERFVAITYSLTYRQIVTACRVSLVIFLSWLVALVVGFAPLIGWKIKTYHNYCSFLYVLPSDYIKFLFSSCVLLPILVTFTMYGLIYKYARRHIKRIEAIENLHLDRRNNRILRFSPRSMKSLKTLSAVFGCVLVTWLPFLLGTIVQVISGNTTCYLKDIVGTHLLLLGFTNSFLNPLIYAVGTKDFRDKVRDTFGRRTSCNSP
ncbi:Glucose-dependent insulinotropic receptor [Mizuhopecten yessoensis]|uniref:Glucose-dependent insulinotropic receptor n=1 Tax=Mizuhopecten yessoensis TaxID=6573 RepID=A0A210QT29_MIZYE|nr:Glucose-dependent insulinotropic receptor [Mizuhopecten yessoensis]